MNLDKLNDWPSEKQTKRLIYLGFIILWINFPFLLYFYISANYPVSFLESQLSFSGAIIRAHLKEMSAEQINYYRLLELSDDVYDLAHIFMFFGLSLFLARKFDEDSGWRKSGFLISLLGIIGSICDIIENSFMLMILANPQGFPDSWAVAHSWFAAFKFTLWGLQAVWIICADTKLLKNEEITKKPFLAVLGVGFSHWWPTVLNLSLLALGMA